MPPTTIPEPHPLTCATCDTLFPSAWSLCYHCQDEHQLKIYKIPDYKLEPNCNDGSIWDGLNVSSGQIKLEESTQPHDHDDDDNDNDDQHMELALDTPYSEAVGESKIDLSLNNENNEATSSKESEMTSTKGVGRPKRHIVTSTKVNAKKLKKLFTCKICGKQYHGKVCYNKHMNQFHAVALDESDIEPDPEDGKSTTEMAEVKSEPAELEPMDTPKPTVHTPSEQEQFNETVDDHTEKYQSKQATIENVKLEPHHTDVCLQSKQSSVRKPYKQVKVYLNCDNCSKLVRKDRMKEHMRKHDPNYEEKKRGRKQKTETPKRIKLFLNCENCGKPVRKDRMKDHMRKHDPQIPHTETPKRRKEIKVFLNCENCGKLVRRDRMKEHMMRKHDPHCTYEAPKRDKRNQDRQKISDKVKTRKPKMYWTCEKCGKLIRKDRWEEHMVRKHDQQSDTPELSVPCPICDKTFSKRYLKQHIKLHSGIRMDRGSSTCEYCGKVYHSRHIARHLRTHTGERPYPCTICGKRFLEGGGLKNHMKIHIRGPLPIVACTLCGKTLQEKHMGRHMKAHARPSTRDCTLCGKQYRKSSSLKDHMMKIHMTSS